MKFLEVSFRDAGHAVVVGHALFLLELSLNQKYSEMTRSTGFRIIEKYFMMCFVELCFVEVSFKGSHGKKLFWA